MKLEQKYKEVQQRVCELEQRLFILSEEKRKREERIDSWIGLGLFIFAGTLVLLAAIGVFHLIACGAS